MDKIFLMLEMTSPEFEEIMKKTGIVIVPIGATEQHGPHSPLGTDILFAYEVVKGAARIISKEFGVAVTPPMNIGFSMAEIEWPGTLSFKSPEAMISFIRGICKQLAHQGARKIVLYNGHGGNVGVLQAATRMARRDSGVFVVLAHGWKLGSYLKSLKGWGTEDMFDIHAGDGETSAMLYLFPDLVHMDKARRELPEKFMKLKYMRSLDGDATYPSWLMKDITKTGIVGDATTASKEKGERFFNEAIEGLCALLRELKEMPE
jgi:creatinine amidohydrolase